MADKPHPLADLYNQTHKARLLRALIDRPAGYTTRELATKLYGSDDAHAQQMLCAIARNLRDDLPAGWIIPNALIHRRYQLIDIREGRDAA